MKLIYRSALFLLALVMYILSHVRQDGALFRGYEDSLWVLTLVGVVYTVEMVARFSPPGWKAWAARSSFAAITSPPGRKRRF